MDNETKTYKVIDPRTDGDCFGGEISGSHSALISAVPIAENKNWFDLNVHESSLCIFQVSGKGGPYKVVRVS